MASSKDKSYIDSLLHCYLGQMARYLAQKFVLDKNSVK